MQAALAIMALPGWACGDGMLARVPTGAVVGMDGPLVEVDIAQRGLPNLVIVTLPDAMVREARKRVRAAIRNSGSRFPKRRLYLCWV
jgi:magnesium chelatase family protein